MPGSRKNLSRRDFLKAAGLTLTVASVSCSGLGYAAVRTPNVETQEQLFGKDHPMNNRILVTYATRAGSTVEVAAAIGETLSQRGFKVDLKPVRKAPSLDGYQAVILGSAIRMGNWLPEAVDFVKTNQQALNRMPVALFTVHILNTGNDETSRATRLAYLDSVRLLLKPVDEVFFAGEIDPAKLSFVDRLLVKIVKSPIGDLRDWDKIRSWANATLS